MTDAEVLRDIQTVVDDYAASESPGSCSDAITLKEKRNGITKGLKR